MRTTAVAVVTIETEMSDYRSNSKVQDIIDQAKQEAVHKIERICNGECRIIGVPSVKVVTSFSDK